MSTNSSDSSNSTATDYATTTVVLRSITPWVRILVLIATGMAITGSIYCIIWVYHRRRKPIVVTHQPVLLLFVCIGAMLQYISVIPLSFFGTDAACLSIDWLYYPGFIISYSVLWAKLWRINKIFHNPQYRRISVKATDVLSPIVGVFSLMVLLLLLLSFLDPPRWIVLESSDVGTNDANTTMTIYTYGYCSTTGNADGTILKLIVALCFLTVAASVYQAYLARNISSNFSEAWPLLLALINAIQLNVIYYPLNAILLPADILPSTSYFLEAFIVITDGTNILLAMFLPLYLHPSNRLTPPIITCSNVRIDQRVDPNPVALTVSTRRTCNNNAIRDSDETTHDEVSELVRIKERSSDLVPTQDRSSTFFELVAAATADIDN